MELEVKTKICPKCGQENILKARYCTRLNCDYVFPMETPEQKQKPVSNDSGPKPLQTDTLVYDFQIFAGKINETVNNEIAQCYKSIKSISNASYNDDKMRMAYTVYLANYDAIVNTLDQVKALADKLQITYNQHKERLSSIDRSSTELLELLYQKAYNNTTESVKGLVNKYSHIRPFDHLKSYLLSPVGEWDNTFAHDDLLSSFMYLGIVGKDYEILGQKFRVERREYVELLRANNLVVHYNNATEKLCIELVATIIGRMLNKSPLHLPMCIIDHDLLGLHGGYRYLPDTVCRIESCFDTEEIRELERICQQHGDLTNNQLFVFKDWYTCMKGIRNEEQLGRIMEWGIHTGQCFVIMVNEDTKPPRSSFSRGEEEDVLSRLNNKIVLNLVPKDKVPFPEYDLMGDDLIEKTRNLVQAMDDTIEQNKSIDICELFKNRGSSRNCKLKLTLYIGKDDKLNDKSIELKDDRIHSSLLVRYDNHSHVFPWVKAMIAEAFTLYGSQQMNVVVADFIGCDELDAIHTIDSRQAPFYYYKFKKNASASNKVISTINQFLGERGDQRMLVFLVGKFEDLKNGFVNTKYHDKKNLHLVLLATDVPREVVWEGYQLTFGPKRLESGVELSEDEFIFENKVCYTYSCDNGMVQKLLKDYLPVPPSPQKTASKSIQVQVLSQSVEPLIEPTQEESSFIAQTTSVTFVDTKADVKENSKEDIGEQQITDVSEQEAKSAPAEQHEKKPEDVKTQVASPVEAKPMETEIPVATPIEVQIETVETIEEKEEESEVIGFQEEEDDDVEKYDYQRTFYFRDFMTPLSEWWSQTAKEEMLIPFGIHINRETNADEIWEFRFATNDEMKNAALVLGGSGSGKTAFLRTLIMSAAQIYSPKELEFYLIDFKTTGFEPFEQCRLPHVRVVAGGADREFGFSILQKVKAEVEKRKKNKNPLPRILLIIDECQNFFLDDNRADDAATLLEFIIKQGREFGVNLILATQELSSSTTRIPSSLYNQIAIRYVAKPTENDYTSLFNRSDREVIPLKNIFKKGEALFVGATYMNPEDTIEEYHTKAFYIENKELPDMIKQVSDYAACHPKQCPYDMSLFTFHNDDDLVAFKAKDRMIDEHLSSAVGLPKMIPMYLGQPIAMDNDVFLSLAAKKKQNVLIVGAVPTDDIVSQNIAYIALLSSTKVYPADREGRTTNRLDYVFDFTEEGEPLHGKLAELISQAPFGIGSAVIENEENAVLSKLSEVKEELERRKEEKSSTVQQHIFLTFLGFDRGDMFEEGEDAADVLNTIISEGPKHGIFTIIQALGDENLLKQQLGYGFENEFQHIVALQMNETSSYSLIGSASAGQLYDPLAVDDNQGLYRALYYNTATNTITKFKPYKF